MGWLTDCVTCDARIFHIQSFLRWGVFHPTYTHASHHAGKRQVHAVLEGVLAGTSNTDIHERADDLSELGIRHTLHRTYFQEIQHLAKS